MTGRWKQVSDLKGVEVNEYAECRLLLADGTYKYLTPKVGSFGYLFVNIQGRTYSLARLVANAFLDSTLPSQKVAGDDREIDYISTKRNDASLTNIRIVSAEVNRNLPETRKNYSKKNQQCSKFGTLAYVAYNQDGSFAKLFSGNTIWSDIYDWLASQNRAPKTRYSMRANVYAHLKGKTPTAYGYLWEKMMDNDYTHHKYHDYQIEYHRRWVAERKKEQENNIKNSNIK